ncbi:hypothetical protein [Paenibacillus aquistagni]|uniref:Uncharacterized protein n=1 Tax=Paenibacillus aquistagni TaxID=1852522 RepID=A0A1X7LT87_9BACL|nr:hypothetical protein [Paenibacillus aquistagni]SMG56482.1 hypothetical protein SAMN06295960_4142 [Paenibacillus aquistagni]
MNVKSINNWLKNIGGYKVRRCLCELRLSRKIPFEGSDQLTADDIQKLQNVIEFLKGQEAMFIDVCSSLQDEHRAVLTDRLLNNDRNVDKETLKLAKRELVRELKRLLKAQHIEFEELKGNYYVRSQMPLAEGGTTE